MSQLRKDPDVDKTFGFNWATYLDDLGVSLTIEASEWDLPDGVTEVDSDFTDTTTSIQLSGGTDGIDYELLNRITLSNADTEEKTIVVQVREASWRLTEDEILTLAEITLETSDTIESLASDLTVNKATYLRGEMATWATIRDSHVKLSGGSDGVDFNNARKRDAIRERVRKAFGLPLYSLESQPGSFSIPVRAVF